MKKNLPLTRKTLRLHLTKLSILVLSFLCLVTGFKVSGAIRQDVSAKKISIALKDVTLRSALNKISDLADVSFVYVNSEALDKNKVSITAQNEQVGVLLKKLLTPHSFSYTVVDDRIVIRHDAEKVFNPFPEGLKTGVDYPWLLHQNPAHPGLPSYLPAYFYRFYGYVLHRSLFHITLSTADRDLAAFV